MGVRTISMLTFMMLFCCTAVSSRKQKDLNKDEMLALLKQVGATNTTAIRTDGLYEIDPMREEHATIYTCPILFFKGGIMDAVGQGVTIDHDHLSKLYGEYFDNHNKAFETFGTYELHGTNIDAYFYTNFEGWGGRIKICLVHYKGTLSDRNTISGWHMVPPYPAASGKLNHDFKGYTSPATLVFKPFPAQQLIRDKRIWLEAFR